MDLDDETLTAIRAALRLGFHLRPETGSALVAEVDRLRAEAAVREAEARATAAWLRSTGYPVDWSTPTALPPEHLREEVVRAWWEEATSNGDETPLAGWWRLCAEEGGWPDLDDRPALRVVED